MGITRIKSSNTWQICRLYLLTRKALAISLVQNPKRRFCRKTFPNYYACDPKPFLLFASKAVNWKPNPNIAVRQTVKAADRSQDNIGRSMVCIPAPPSARKSCVGEVYSRRHLRVSSTKLEGMAASLPGPDTCFWNQTPFPAQISERCSLRSRRVILFARTRYQRGKNRRKAMMRCPPKQLLLETSALKQGYLSFTRQSSTLQPENVQEQWGSRNSGSRNSTGTCEDRWNC